ncbi:hypothetical protein ACFYOV_10100 [Streptomyces sp. NPDC005931]|uniref:hypothetical protein n=1 Tax=Streptomyces sp. NPDC005931 TaxID=3364737 RepID=UPI0036BBEA9A
MTEGLDDGPHGARGPWAGRPPAAASALAAEVEGYLMARAHYEDARREAEELCGRLPWLTASQAEDLARHHVLQRIDLTRRTLRETARRADELAQEYEDRYRDLRRTLLRRHAAGACAVLACAAGVSTLTPLLAR